MWGCRVGRKDKQAATSMLRTYVTHLDPQALETGPCFSTAFPLARFMRLSVISRYS
jgi:hypothetical protein